MRSRTILWRGEWVLVWLLAALVSLPSAVHATPQPLSCWLVPLTDLVVEVERNRDGSVSQVIVVEHGRPMVMNEIAMAEGGERTRVFGAILSGRLLYFAAARDGRVLLGAMSVGWAMRLLDTPNFTDGVSDVEAQRFAESVAAALEMLNQRTVLAAGRCEDW